jgi:hypothetical protein
VFPSPRAEARARRASEARRHRPVFVDDSGRRRRAIRIVGTTSAVVVVAYVAFVGSTFAGVPGAGRLEAPWLGALTNPADGGADVGSDPVEQSAPAAVVGVADPAPSSARDRTNPGEVSAEPATTPPTTAAPAGAGSAATTTSVPATTTTTVHGHRGNPNGSSPSSTVPDKGGPPTSSPAGQ